MPVEETFCGFPRVEGAVGGGAGLSVENCGHDLPMGFYFDGKRRASCRLLTEGGFLVGVEKSRNSSGGYQAVLCKEYTESS